jgi:hypothetical protein
MQKAKKQMVHKGSNPGQFAKQQKNSPATGASGDMQVDSPPTLRKNYRQLALRRPRLTQLETPGGI